LTLTLFARAPAERAGVNLAEPDTLAIDLQAAYLRYGPLVFRRCRALLRNDAQAEEAMQDVFVRLLSQRETLHELALTGLLFRMATQVSLNRLRTRRRHPESPDDALLHELAAAPESDMRAVAAALVSRLLGREPISTRVMATLHFVDGMTLEEVAAEVGMSVSGVRKRLRALRVRANLLVEAEDG
jgi:RNA polymerase sigma-70 factor (ECF subfamily)